eukprot:Partr_v1_DN28947_c0_g1_i1_m24981 putative Conserved hypothetical protein
MNIQHGIPDEGHRHVHYYQSNDDGAEEMSTDDYPSSCFDEILPDGGLKDYDRSQPPSGYPYLGRREAAGSYMQPSSARIRIYEPIRSYPSISHQVRERNEAQYRKHYLTHPRYGWQHPAYMRFLGPAQYPPDFSMVYGSGPRADHYYPGLTPKDVVLAKSTKKGVTRPGFHSPQPLRDNEISNARQTMQSMASVLYEGYLPDNVEIVAGMDSIVMAIHNYARHNQLSEESTIVLQDVIDILGLLRKFLYTINGDEKVQKLIHHSVLTARIAREQASRIAKRQESLLGMGPGGASIQTPQRQPTSSLGLQFVGLLLGGEFRQVLLNIAHLAGEIIGGEFGGQESQQQMPQYTYARGSQPMQQRPQLMQQQRDLNIMQEPYPTVDQEAIIQAGKQRQGQSFVMNNKRYRMVDSEVLADGGEYEEEPYERGESSAQAQARAGGETEAEQPEAIPVRMEAEEVEWKQPRHMGQWEDVAVEEAAEIGTGAPQGRQRVDVEFQDQQTPSGSTFTDSQGRQWRVVQEGHVSISQAQPQPQTRAFIRIPQVQQQQYQDSQRFTAPQKVPSRQRYTVQEQIPTQKRYTEQEQIPTQSRAQQPMPSQRRYTAQQQIPRYRMQQAAPVQFPSYAPEPPTQQRYQPQQYHAQGQQMENDEVGDESTIGKSYQLMESIRHLLIEIRGKEHIRNGLQTVIESIVNLGSEGGAATAMYEDANRTEMMKEMSRLIEALSNGRDVKGLIGAIDKFQRIYERDFRFRDYIDDVYAFVSRCMNDPEYLDSSDFLPKSVNMLQRGRRMIQGKYQTEASEAFDAFFDIINGFRSNELLEDLAKASAKLYKDTFIDPNSQQFTLKQSILRDVKSLYLPMILKAFRYLPMPRIEISDAGYDFAFDNIVFATENLVPTLVEFKVENQVQVSPRPDLPDAYCLNVNTMDIMQIQADLRDVEFAYKKKSFPTLQDSGLADILLGGNGLSIHVRMAYDPNLWYTTLVPYDIDCSIDSMSIRVRESSRDAMYKIIGTTITAAMKKRICRALEEAIYNSIVRADGILTSVATSGGPKKKVVGLPVD